MFSGGCESTAAIEREFQEGREAELILAHVSCSQHEGPWPYVYGVTPIHEYYELRARMSIPLLMYNVDWPTIPASSFLVHFIASQLIRDGEYEIDVWIETSLYNTADGVRRRGFSYSILHGGLYQDWTGEPKDISIERPFEDMTKAEIYSTIPEEVRPFLWTCRQPMDGRPCGKCAKCSELENVKNRAVA